MTLLELSALSRVAPRQQVLPRSAGSRARVLDLFCGAGGFSLGAKKAGCEVVLGVDYDEDAIQTALGFGLRAELRDVASLVRDHPKSIDLVVGGPPCQPYTGQGERGGRRDARDGFPVAIEVLAAIRPRAVLLENVRGFLAPRHAGYRASIVKSLRKLFPHVGTWALDARDFGVPQDRARVFLWGADRPLDPPVPTHGPGTGRSYATVRQALPGLGAPAIHVRSTAATSRLTDGPSPTVTGRATMYTSPRAGLSYRDGTAAEVAARRGQRALTVAELAVLQGFAAGARFSGTSSSQHQQVANAVPPALAEAVVRAVLRYG